MNLLTGDRETGAYHFLQGGGEMGKLTRNFDWSLTAIGDPVGWPHSLRTMVALVLNSKFPMFLWWGKELIQFYNDAYRPSLGNDGKHPAALGQRAVECWPEIWDIIHPLILQVLNTGEATWSEDQLVPIFRNGKIEDVYWTFGYSPINNDFGNIEGVLVVCNETTAKVNNVRNQAAILKKIEESEERFRTMAEGTDILIAVGDESGNSTYFNKAWVDLTGRSVEDFLKIGWADLVHPDERERHMKVYLDAFKKQEPFTAEFRVLNKEGNFSWVLTTGSPRFRKDGSFAGYISSCIDITGRKKAEDALKQSEQQVLSLVESAPFPIGVYTGREMRIELANQAILDAWGKAKDVIGKLLKDILPGSIDQGMFQQLDHVFTSGISFHARNQRIMIVGDGKMQPRHFNYSFVPLYDAFGEVYGVMNTAAEVTDLNLAKQKVEENEKSFRNTILKAPVAMCIFRGPKHVVEIANDRMIELWGRTSEEILNKPIFEGLPESGNQGFEELLDNVLNTGEAFSAQDIPITLPRNGKPELVYVSFLYEAYKEENGSISGIIAVAMDVTAEVFARHKIEEVVTERTRELAEANSNLQRSNAELAQFAYIASHDLQEPIRKVSTFSQLLERSLGTIDEQSKSYLQKINRSSTRMLALIRDVLTFSQLSQQRQVFGHVSLDNIVREVVSDFELLIEQKNAVIRFAGLPSIEAIPLQMFQLFGNLISNALKYCRVEERPLITISAGILTEQEQSDIDFPDLDGGYYRIEVRDNGIGFKQENAEHIFSIFQRLHRISEYEGTGIGLAMCKKIAQNHHGNIFAAGNPGAGASFTIILPVKQKNTR